ncbi:MAG: hypothetical protein K8M05_13920, partial [Deltaproteobacteria bacterium]|nr:hypothetical protein [Kofleriaceae bacterium]
SATGTGNGTGNGTGDGTGHRDGHARRDGRLARVTGSAVATGFAWMFSGARLPAPRLVDLALSAMERSRS